MTDAENRLALHGAGSGAAAGRTNGAFAAQGLALGPPPADQRLMIDTLIAAALLLATGANDTDAARGTGTAPTSEASCSALAAESDALKAQLQRRIGDRAPANAHAQAAAQGATAMAAAAGEVAASVAPLPGKIVSAIAQEAHKQQARHGVASAETMMREALALSTRLQAVEAERNARCTPEQER